jgi:hypothetical protein
VTEVSVSKDASAETSGDEDTFEGQCQGTKGDGERCRNKATDGTRYCGVHAKLGETDGMCKGHYADGRPCNNRAREDSVYCGVHAKDQAARK